MIKGVIFDLDGTLLDSNQFWGKSPSEFLKRAGRTPEPHIAEKLFTMTIHEGADYLINEYGLEHTPEEVIKGIKDEMKRFYLNEVPLKQGTEKLLGTLKTLGLPMTIATVTDRELAESVLERFGILGFFKDIITAADAGAGKYDPDIYMMASSRIGTVPEETIVFEDALYAIHTAKKAGFKVAGVYDEAGRDKWNEIKTICDISFFDFSDLNELIMRIDK